MKYALVKDERTVSSTPILASIIGFFVAVSLLLGILGGYVLGGLMLLLVLAMLPVVGIFTFARWLIRLRTAQAPEVALQPTDEVSLTLGAATGLQTIDIFTELSKEELAQVAAVGQPISVPQGTLLARQDDTATSVYMILEGQVQLTTSSPQGEITVRIAGPGESLPLAALLGSGKLLTNAYTMTDLRGMEIPHDKLRELLLQQPEIGMKVYRAVADILGGRYQNTLTRLVGTMEHALRQADVFANV
jgi:CRP-like cAMP-binding protein